MITIKSVNLKQLHSLSNAAFNFTDTDDLRSAGLISLAPLHQLKLKTDTRTDIYIIDGHLIEKNTQYPAETFLSRGDDASLVADTDGALLFMYIDHVAVRSGNETARINDHQWIDGGANGMKVATLSRTSHHLMLVSWMPGTRMGFHVHPRGEEIFVLTGELCDQRGRYPTGTWMRFHSNSGHAPYAETKTQILLRNGHLPQRA